MQSESLSVSLRRRFLLSLFLAICLFLALGLLTGGVLSGAEGLSSPSAPVTDACAPITVDTTWASGVYTASNCSVMVPAGVTLTLESGVIIKFGGKCGYVNGCGMRVDGGLIANGTVAQPVIFTSLADDSAGGDTNEDGASVGAPGEWYGVYLAPDSQATLDHVSIRYGGAEWAFNSALHGWSRAHVDVTDAQLTLTHSEVISGANNGIYLEGEGLTPVLQQVRVADQTNPTNDYRYQYAIYQSTINMQPTYADLTFSGNARNEVTIGNFRQTITEDVTLGGTNYGFTCGYTLCQLTVPDGQTLTVAPGTLLDFSASYGIAVADGGALVALGSVSQPITFTSKLAAAGDTSQYWMGLWAKQGSTLHLDQCDISYASDGNFGDGGLEINTDQAEVSNCHIHHNKHTGLYVRANSGTTIAPTLTNIHVTDNGEHGVYLEAGVSSSLSVNWEGGSISRNGWSGVAEYTSNSTINPTLGNMTISENGALGTNDDRRRGISFDNHNVNPVLTDVTLTDNVGAAISWLCNGSITAKDLIATGNGADELLIPGCALGGGRQWDLGDAGIPVRVTGSIEVSSNGLLSIKPGTTLAFDKNIYGSPTYLLVKDTGALYALGTAEKPIVFTGATQETGWWAGIEAKDRATISLDHCEISYGGAAFTNNLSALLDIRWGLSGGAPTATIQNCHIHHSDKAGVQFDFNNYVTTPPVFRNNSIHDTTREAVANWDAPVLDARNNWWGDASGPYHATLNPSGLGDNVGDNITFYPWLAAPGTGQTAPGEMLVTTGSPTLVSPGQTADYAVQYLNTLTETVQNAVLLVQLPLSGEYVASSGGGIYWPERDQLFWKLGDLAPGAQGFLSFTVRFAWGLPRTYQDSTITLLTADNYNPGEFDAQAYLDYLPGEMSAVDLLTPTQFNAQLAANPALQSAYDTAITAGFSFHTAANVARSEGEVVLEAVMVNSGLRIARILALQGGHVLIYTVNAGSATIEDSTGGMRLDLLTGEKSVWGAWEADLAGASVSLPADGEATTGCTVDICKRNCRWSIVGWEYIKKKAGRIVAWTALAPFTGGGSIAGAVWEVGSTVKKIYDCDLDCRANPSEYCCTAGQVRWIGGGIFGGLTNSCYKEVCNATVGAWVPGGYKTCIAYGQRCVPSIGGPGCVDCEEKGLVQRTETRTVTVMSSMPEPEDPNSCSATAAGGKPRCRDLRLFIAKDPNAIYGPAGDLLPGATTLYTVTFENEGAGRAYGVYVTNKLADVFDAATLDLHGSGVYLPDSREIFWMVGELGPKGAADSEGTITYTVNLTGGLASGTVVENQAVVFFPSVPEETPTNTWVNLVSPLVAIPQSLSTAYMTPLTITLAGQEASQLPLTFEMVEPPHGGVLSGTAPDLTYTPLENFTGPDSFSFRVDNGTSTSRAAQVSIEVTSVGDTTPPQVVWTSPAADAKNVIASASPVFTDTDGPVYAPVIVIGVSEALSETTVTTATVTLVDRVGKPVTGTVHFDGAVNQIVFAPLAPLTPGTYTVTVSTGVADMAGNGLAAPHILAFTVKDEQAGSEIYLPALQK